MNKIKFRAWDKLKKKIVDVAAINWIEGFATLWKKTGTARSTYCAELDTLELMQYTGLKDKNGKSGYESDFFKDKHGFVYRIEHDIDGWIFVNGDVGYRPSTFKTSVPYSLDGEFIGNIFENPELMEESK